MPNRPLPVTDSDDYTGTLPVRLDPATLKALLAPSSFRQRVPHRPRVDAGHRRSRHLLAFLVQPAAVCADCVVHRRPTTRAHHPDARGHTPPALPLWHIVNDWVTDAIPRLAARTRLDAALYRPHHFPHDRFLNTYNDPDWMRKQTADWEFPKTKRDMTRVLAYQGLGLGIARFVLIVIRLPKAQRGGPGDRAARSASLSIRISAALSDRGCAARP